MRAPGPDRAPMPDLGRRDELPSAENAIRAYLEEMELMDVLTAHGKEMNPVRTSDEIIATIAPELEKGIEGWETNLIQVAHRSSKQRLG